MNIGADVWDESSILTVFINAGARLLYTSDGVCVIVYVKLSSVGASTVLAGGGSSLHSGIEFGRRRTGEGSSGNPTPRPPLPRQQGKERLGPSYFFIPLVIGPLNSLVWWEVPLGYIALG